MQMRVYKKDKSFSCSLIEETLMNKEWSELNKTLQQQLKKKDSYEDGVSTLGLLREDLFKTIGCCVPVARV